MRLGEPINYSAKAVPGFCLISDFIVGVQRLEHRCEDVGPPDVES